MTFCAIAYTSVALFGVLAFGDQIYPDLMLNYDANDLLVLIGITIVAFKTITTYPVLLYCARTAIDDFLVLRLRIINPEQYQLERRLIIVFPWFFATVSLAIVLPDIGSVIRIIGSLAIIFIFVIPGICLISVSNLIPSHEMTLCRYYLLNAIGSLYTLIGAFIFGVSITQSIEYLFYKDDAPNNAPYCKSDEY